MAVLLSSELSLLAQTPQTDAYPRELVPPEEDAAPVPARFGRQVPGRRVRVEPERRIGLGEPAEPLDEVVARPLATNTRPSLSRTALPNTCP